jgi:hypothetical protein
VVVEFKRIDQSNEVPFVLWIKRVVQQPSHLDLQQTLVVIRSLVLDDFDRHQLLRTILLTFENLTECAGTEQVENGVTIGAAYNFVMNSTDQIGFLVVSAIVQQPFRGICQNTLWQFIWNTK